MAPILHSCPAIISSSPITLHTANTSLCLLYIYIHVEARRGHSTEEVMAWIIVLMSRLAGPGQLHPDTAPAMCHAVISNITLSYCHTVMLSHCHTVILLYCHPATAIILTHFAADFLHLLSWRPYSIIGFLENTRQPHRGEDNYLLKIMF